MKLYESGENYLETILILSQKNSVVRSIDIAHELNFSKPSVSRAMSLLKESGYITIKDLNIKLTEKGLNKANDVYDKHNTIAKFLVKTLGIEESEAYVDSCRIEHVLSDKTFSKMKEYLKLK